MHKQDDVPWQCSSIAIVLRVASRLAPIATAPHPAASQTRDAAPHHRRIAASDGEGGGAVPSGRCSLCTPLAAVRQLHWPLRSVGAMTVLPGGTRGVMSLADLFANPSGAVEIGVGSDCRVFAGVVNEPQVGVGRPFSRPVAMKVVTVRGSSDHPPAIKRMTGLYREAAVCNAVAVHQAADPSPSNKARLLASFLGVVTSESLPSSSNIVRGGCSGGVHSIALVHEYCDLGTLDQLIHRRRRAYGASRSSAALPSPLLTEREAASILGAMCNALDFLHSNMRVLHRDVKPQNIFLASVDSAAACDGGRGEGGGLGADGSCSSSDAVVPVRVVLGDLGLSRMALGARTTCGTPKFMAPEVMVGTAGAHTFPSIATSMQRQCSPRPPSSSAAPAGSPTQSPAPSSRSAGADGYSGAADVFSLGVTLQCAIAGGAPEAIRVPWILPGVPAAKYNNGGHCMSGRVGEACGGGGGAVFAVPVGWYCSASAAACRCQKLHRPTVELLNLMIHPDPSKRPTARSVRNHDAVLRHTYHVTTLLRDRLATAGRRHDESLSHGAVGVSGCASPGIASAWASLDGKHEAKWLHALVLPQREADALRSADVQNHWRHTTARSPRLSATSPPQQPSHVQQPSSAPVPHCAATSTSATTTCVVDRIPPLRTPVGRPQQQHHLPKQHMHRGAAVQKQTHHGIAPATFHEYVEYFSPPTTAVEDRRRLSTFPSTSSG